jgi:predicted transglutaminase-like cysteine proteinase
MELNEAIRMVNEKFKYEADSKFILDSWAVMQEKDGLLKGDCEDYSLTVLWYLNDCSLWKFIKNVIILHKHRMYYVKAIPDNGGHAVANVGNLWFDNWTKEALPKDEFFDRTKHKKWFMYPMPLMVPFFIYGLLKR